MPIVAMTPASQRGWLIMRLNGYIVGDAGRILVWTTVSMPVTLVLLVLATMMLKTRQEHMLPIKVMNH